MTSAMDSNPPASAGWRRLLQPFRPPFETARHYNWHKFRKDIVAGLTVSVVEVPQAMAYALIAGVPPQYGLYTSVIQGIIGALLSSSEHMTTGPTNTQSLLIASAVHRLASPTADPELYLQLVFALTMLKGLIQLGFAAASMGNMVRYVSRSVISGLVSGAGFLIFFGQLPALLGITAGRGNDAAGVLGPLVRLAHHCREVNLRAAAVGLGVIAVVLAARRISKFFPGALLAVIASAAVVWGAGWTAGQLPLIDQLPRSFPHFHVAHVGWQQAEELFGGALALAVIGMLESVSIAKSIAVRSGEKISANQEFFAQGLKNFTSSFFQCIPGSGSFTRSSLDYAAGAETRFAAVFNACFVGIIFWLLAEQAHFVPRASLAGVLIVIAIGLVEWSYIPRVRRSNRTDVIVCLATFFATLLVPLEYAIFAGVLLNIGLYLRTASHLHVNEMVPGTPGGPFIERELRDRAGNRPVVLLQVEGDLFFGVADELSDRLATVVRGGARVVVLRLRRTHSIDATALDALEHFTRDFQGIGGHVILCGVRPHLAPVLENFGVIGLIGKENFFQTAPGIFGSAKLALARAQTLLGRSLDLDRLNAENDEQTWSYDI